MDGLTASPDLDRLTARVAELIDAGRLGAARPLIAALRTAGAGLAAPRGTRRRPGAEGGAVRRGAGGAGPALAVLAGKRRLLQVPRRCAPPAGRFGRRRARRRRGRGARPAATPTRRQSLGWRCWRSVARGCARLPGRGRGPRAGEPDCFARRWRTRRRCGDAEAAAATLDDGIARAPADTSLHNAAVLHALRRRDFAEAVELAEAARRAGAVDACLFGLMGHALSSLGRHDEAAEAYAEALKLGPDDPYVRHLVAASGALPERRPRADRLHARRVRRVRRPLRGAPDLARLSRARPDPRRPAAPCVERRGGAARPGARPWLRHRTGGGGAARLPVGPITGVDLSPRMLAAAAAKQLYADFARTTSCGCWRPRTALARHPRGRRALLLRRAGGHHGCRSPPARPRRSVPVQCRDAEGHAAAAAVGASASTGATPIRLDYVHRTAEAAGFAVVELANETLR